MYFKLQMLYNYKLNRPFLPGDEIEVRVVKGLEDSWIPYKLDEVDIKADKLWLNILSTERGVRQKLDDVEQEYISSDDLEDLGFHWMPDEMNYSWHIKHHYSKPVHENFHWNLKAEKAYKTYPYQYPLLSVYAVNDKSELVAEKCFKNKQELIDTLNEIWLDKFNKDVEK